MPRTPDQPVTTEVGQRRRAELLEAARTVFERDGYAETNVSEIIRLSGGSRASFYSYFTSKDALLEELVNDVVDDLFAAATQPLDAGLDPCYWLRATIRQFMHAYRDRAPMLAVLDQATTATETFRSIRLEIRMRFARGIAAQIDQRPVATDTKPLDPETTAIALGGMVEDMARGRYLLGHDLDDELVVDTLTAMWARVVGLPIP